MNNDILTVDEVADKLRVKPSWVYSHADKLGAYHLGKYLRFSWERVLTYLENNAGMLVSQSNDPLQTIENNSCKNRMEQN